MRKSGPPARANARNAFAKQQQVVLWHADGLVHDADRPDLVHVIGAGRIDPRVLLWVAPAVAWAAVASGVAKEMIDLEQYREQLEARLGRARGIMRGIINRAVREPNLQDELGRNGR